MLKTVQELQAELKTKVAEVDAPFVFSHVEKKQLPFVLLDVRDPNEHAKGIIPGATPISRGTLEMNIQRVVTDPKQEIVCYCGGGTRSLFAAEQLQRMGYLNVKSMAGGYRAWTTAGLPIVAP